MGTDVSILSFPGAPPRAFAAPQRVLEARTPDEVRPLLREVEKECRAGRWAVGFVGYEAAPAFDAALVVRPPEGPTPLAWFALHDGPGDVATLAGAGAALQWEADTPAAAHADAVAEIRERIASGDVYQVNHTLRFHAPVPRGFDARALYASLARGRQGLYHAFIDGGEWCIVSASPELFVETQRVGHETVIRTRPMKGTHRRGRWLEEDARAAAALAASAKDRAENLMIVDLLRNDLGRVAQWGTVNVEGLYRVETFPTVHQMTSVVRAVLRRDASLDDVFAATFPCGSVTGAPKVTAMQAIRDLETSPRGPYCGAIGVVRPDGTFTFSVGIRTVVIDRVSSVAVYGSGSGITWDSRADAEYDEIAAKAALLHEAAPDFALLETLRVEDGVPLRLERHVQRLRDSAAYWNFAPLAADAARNEMVRTARGSHAERGAAAMRMRVLVHADGRVESTLDAIPPVPPAVLAPCGRPRVALAPEPVERSNPLLFHKCTARDHYTRRRDARPDAWDVLLRNEQGMVTEFTIGNVVVELDGVMCTPPREAGLLAGCMRSELLEDGRVVVRELPVEDVQRAARVWLVNSLRGMVEVVLVP